MEEQNTSLQQFHLTKSDRQLLSISGCFVRERTTPENLAISQFIVHTSVSIQEICLYHNNTTCRLATAKIQVPTPPL